MDATKRRRVSGEEPETMARLPEELVLEILTWVPARELGRCKGVCRLWKSLIGSPQFLPLYRRRNRCMIAYWSESGRLHFYYSPIWRHRTEPEEKFRRLGSLPMGRAIDPLTQPVNGVICQGKVTGGDVQLIVYSLCTGQGLRVPPPPQDGGDTESLYSLGYDPRSRRYKLLRFVFRVDPEDGSVNSDHRMRAEVITLGPTGTVWKWRKLDDDGAGIRRLPVGTHSLYYCVRHGMLMFSGDGALSWRHNTKAIILFDVHRERFRWVKLPPEVHADVYDDQRTMVPRVRFSDNRTAFHLWVLPVGGEKYKPEIDCFILGDEEGSVWKKSTEALRAGLQDSGSWYGIVNGSLMPDASIMVMNASQYKFSGRRRELYSTNGMRRFWVGQPPNWGITDRRNELEVDSGDGHTRWGSIIATSKFSLLRKRKICRIRYGVTPFTPLRGLFKGPVFIRFFLSINNMVEKVPSFKEGGAFWFTDLTTPDPMYILPVLTALTFWITLEGLFCYWITSNVFSLTYGLVIKNPAVKKSLNIPEITEPPPSPSTD